MSEEVDINNTLPPLPSLPSNDSDDEHSTLLPDLPSTQDDEPSHEYNTEQLPPLPTDDDTLPQLQQRSQQQLANSVNQWQSLTNDENSALPTSPLPVKHSTLRTIKSNTTTKKIEPNKESIDNSKSTKESINESSQQQQQVDVIDASMRGQYAVPLRVAKRVDEEAALEQKRRVARQQEQQQANDKPPPPPGLPPAVAKDLQDSASLLSEIDSILTSGGVDVPDDEQHVPKMPTLGATQVKDYLNSVGDDESMQQPPPELMSRHSTASSVGFLEHFDLDALLADESSLLQAQLDVDEEDEWAEEGDYEYFDEEESYDDQMFHAPHTPADSIVDEPRLSDFGPPPDTPAPDPPSDSEQSSPLDYIADDDERDSFKPLPPSEPYPTEKSSVGDTVVGDTVVGDKAAKATASDEQSNIASLNTEPQPDIVDVESSPLSTPVAPAAIASDEQTPLPPSPPDTSNNDAPVSRLSSAQLTPPPSPGPSAPSTPPPQPPTSTATADADVSDAPPAVDVLPPPPSPPPANDAPPEPDEEPSEPNQPPPEPESVRFPPLPSDATSLPVAVHLPPPPSERDIEHSPTTSTIGAATAASAVSRPSIGEVGAVAPPAKPAPPSTKPPVTTKPPVIEPPSTKPPVTKPPAIKPSGTKAAIASPPDPKFLEAVRRASEKATTSIVDTKSTSSSATVATKNNTSSSSSSSSTKKDAKKKKKAKKMCGSCSVRRATHRATLVTGQVLNLCQQCTERARNAKAAAAANARQAGLVAPKSPSAVARKHARGMRYLEKVLPNVDKAVLEAALKKHKLDFVAAGDELKAERNVVAAPPPANPLAPLPPRGAPPRHLERQSREYRASQMATSRQLLVLKEAVARADADAAIASNPTDVSLLESVEAERITELRLRLAQEQRVRAETRALRADLLAKLDKLKRRRVVERDRVESLVRQVRWLQKENAAARDIDAVRRDKRACVRKLLSLDERERLLVGMLRRTDADRLRSDRARAALTSELAALTRELEKKAETVTTNSRREKSLKFAAQELRHLSDMKRDGDGLLLIPREPTRPPSGVKPSAAPAQAAWQAPQQPKSAKSRLHQLGAQRPGSRALSTAASNTNEEGADAQQDDAAPPVAPSPSVAAGPPATPPRTLKPTPAVQPASPATARPANSVGNVSPRGAAAVSLGSGKREARPAQTPPQSIDAPASDNKQAVMARIAAAISGGGTPPIHRRNSNTGNSNDGSANSTSSQSPRSRSPLSLRRRKNEGDNSGRAKSPIRSGRAKSPIRSLSPKRTKSPKRAKSPTRSQSPSVPQRSTSIVQKKLTPAEAASRMTEVDEEMSRLRKDDQAMNALIDFYAKDPDGAAKVERERRQVAQKLAALRDERNTLLAALGTELKPLDDQLAKRQLQEVEAALVAREKAKDGLARLVGMYANDPSRAAGRQKAEDELADIEIEVVSLEKRRDALRKIVHASKRATLMLTKRNASAQASQAGANSAAANNNGGKNSGVFTVSDDAVVEESALWFLCVTDDNDEYYYNPSRDETSWEVPPNVDVSLVRAWDETETADTNKDDLDDDDDDDAALTAEVDAMELKHLLWSGAELRCLAGGASSGDAARVFVWAPEDMTALRWRPVGSPSHQASPCGLSSARGELSPPKLNDAQPDSTNVRVVDIDGKLLLRLICSSEAEARRWAAAIRLIRKAQRQSGEFMAVKGKWTQYWSASQNAPYYYNEETEETTWESDVFN